MLTNIPTESGHRALETLAVNVVEMARQTHRRLHSR